MAKLEDIKAGTMLKGITGAEPVSVIAVKWHGTTALSITYRHTDGTLGDRLLFRSNETNLELAQPSTHWGFDGDANTFRLISEAYRIHLAHLFDPYLAVHSSEIEPLPHQISAVYQEMLPRLPLRYILADDPGAGKTIMTGLFLKELIVRGDLNRCLIVCPGSLAEQWQDELYQKFHLRFEILTNDRINSAVTGNVFNELNFCIARLDKLARDEATQEKLKVSEWDLIVCDEAHKMSATVWGGEVKYTKRFNLGRLLSTLSRHFLLLTATPHNGKEEDFQLFMSLIDQDRFEGVARNRHEKVEIADVMRRLVKEDLLKFDGTPLFPERKAYTVNYDLSEKEAELYNAVTTYVQEEFNRADNLETGRKNTVGFALTVLQRRLASSPEAIYQSLKRRRERLEARLNEEKQEKELFRFKLPSYYYADDDSYDEDDYSSEELETNEEELIDQATAARNIQELEAELVTLRRLERMGNDVRQSGEDRKWEELSRLLQDDENMFGEYGTPEKLIIFTEHRDTLRYLDHKISSLLGDEQAVVTIHGGISRDERRRIQELFKQDKDVRILIATDAAGEGINLQRAHLMVNYDLPWNPNRIEQRFGRIHRIGQTEVCHLWNLVSKNTREGLVFQRLFEKLEQVRETLKGKVFDVLGDISFDNQSLRDLLIEAIRYGNDPEVRARLTRVVDKALDRDSLRKLIEDHALTEDTIDVHQVMAIREDMERAQARRLQPHFIESFFLEAFRGLGGQIHPRESGRYEITRVPHEVRSRQQKVAGREPILRKYERVCFEKENITLPGKALADLIAPGHPLLDATIDLLLERNLGVLKQGTIFVDDNDPGQDLRLLVYIKDSVQDGILLPNGSRRIISRQLHFIERKAEGAPSHAGYAPYLDYRPAKAEELKLIKPVLEQQAWLKEDLEASAIDFAVSQIIPMHLAEVSARKTKRIDKIYEAVDERLTTEIQYWDYRSAELKRQEAEGKPNAKLNSQQAARRADELSIRRKKRLAELEQERQITATPPIISAGALIVPRGLLDALSGQVPDFSTDPLARQRVEALAMRAVMDIERQLGYSPRDVSAEKVGYDIESTIPLELCQPDGASLRFIEVKGRAAGARTVTVSKNEILTALNKPEEYILALVEVDDERYQTRYLRSPFKQKPDFASTGVIYSIAELLNTAELILEQGNH
jgi:superfamily II DNA or RNA helicase